MLSTAPAEVRPRVVMFVYKDVTHDSRVLREGRTLHAVGYDVTLIAHALPTDPEGIVRARMGDLDVIRVPVQAGWRRTWSVIRTPWRHWPADARAVAAGLRRGPQGWRDAALLVLRRVAALPLTLPAVLVSVVPAVLMPRSPNADLVDWLLRWRFGVLAWSRVAADAAPAADVYHGHDLTALPAAARVAGRTGARLVYDSHEIFMESGRNALRPRWARWLFTALERRLARRADAIVTVNDALAAELQRRLAPRRVVAVHNTPSRWWPPADRPDLIRDAAGIPAEAPVALYHGQFFPHRGIDELALALLEPGMERVHAALLGFGPEEGRLRALAAEARFAGRLHVIRGVPPDELLPWVASADVGVSAVAPSTLNHRLSTPNKLFECLAAGVPVVISDLPGMRGVLLGDPDGPLGAVARSLAPADVARAILEVVERPPDDATAMRARCLAAAHRRWNWETESARLVALYRELAPLPASGPANGAAPVHSGR